MIGLYRNGAFRKKISIVSRAFSHERENIVEFRLHDLTGVNFQLHDSKTTKGEKFSTVHHHGQHGLKVKASCHESKDVALWFNEKTNHGAAFGLKASNVEHPKKMNFAFSGSIEFSLGADVYELENIVLGQATDNGHNWWVGGTGRNFKRVQVHDQVGNHAALIVSGDNADFMFSPCTSGADHSFSVTVFKK